MTLLLVSFKQFIVDDSYILLLPVHLFLSSTVYSCPWVMGHLSLSKMLKLKYAWHYAISTFNVNANFMS